MTPLFMVAEVGSIEDYEKREEVRRLYTSIEMCLTHVRQLVDIFGDDAIEGHSGYEAARQNVADQVNDKVDRLRELEQMFTKSETFNKHIVQAFAYPCETGE